MSGFNSVAQYADADLAGQTWTTQFRKTVASAATTTNGWIDYSYFAGSPSANFYASSPSVSAVVEAIRGIYVPNVSPKTQHLKSLNVMTANTASTANARQSLILCDYLLYYPFIDTDAIGEEQLMENTVPIPRYSSGQVVAVGQSASSAIGTFTFTYTNQDGVAGRVSQPNKTFIVGGGGMVVGASGVGASYNPFVLLQAGDSGVQSIQSVTFTGAGGGIYHQDKRRKATLKDKPNQHLDAIIAKSFKEVFNKLTDKKAPKEVQKKANKIVSDYSTEYRPTVNQVDWTEFNRDLEAVQRLFALYNKEFAENQKVITEKLLVDLIENDNIEFLLMH